MNAEVQAQKVGEAVMVAGASVSGGSAAWAWIGSNNEQLTVIFAFLGLCVTIAGYIRSRKK